MRLRKLRAEDAPLMLEWMHDPDVVRDLQTRFEEKTLEDCARFIAAASEPGEDIHFAVTADDADEYMGTVSLKHIGGGKAEFAITVRKCAMGKGISRDAMQAILKYGLEELGLRQIYWCVSPDNRRAVRFYDKNGYRRVSAPEAEGYTAEQRAKYLWYQAGSSE